MRWYVDRIGRINERHRGWFGGSEALPDLPNPLVDGQLAQEPRQHDLTLDATGSRWDLVDHRWYRVDQPTAHLDRHHQGEFDQPRQ